MLKPGLNIKGEKTMRKLYIFALLALTLLVIGIAYAEQMTFSTYYPAPFGVYNQMVVRTLGVGDMNDDGNINYLDAPDPNDEDQKNDLWVAGKVGVGTNNPRESLHVQGAVLTGGTRGNLYYDGAWKYLRNSEYGQAITYNNVNGGIYFANTSATGLADSTANLENRMVIDKNGNVGIGTTNPQAVLDIDSTESALLPPRMDSDTRDAISPRVKGMVIYNTDTDTLEICDGTNWQAVGGGAIAQVVNFQTGAYATGNAKIPFDNTIPQQNEGT